MRVPIGLALLVCACWLVPISADAQLALIQGAPFTATRTRVINDGEQSYSVSGRVARSSNGSTYEEMPDHKTGEIFLIAIWDVPGQRSVLLDLKRKQYSVKPQSVRVGQIASGDALRDQIEYLKTLKPYQTAMDNGTTGEVTPLGFRTQDGFVEFGRRTVFELRPTSTLKSKVWEEWTVPALQLTVENTGFNAEGKPASVTRLTDIQTKEPDAHLFEIPSDFTPLTVPGAVNGTRSH